MATEKKETTLTSLQQKLDAITFKNAQAEKIKSIQEGTERLKDNLGRNRKKYQAAVDRVQGLQGLQGMGNTLGNQFKKTKS
jgi:hypothetical protein